MRRKLATTIAALCALAVPMDAPAAPTAGTLKQCLGHRVTVQTIRPGLAMVAFKDGIQARVFFFKTPMAAEKVWVMSLVGQRTGSTIVDWYTATGGAHKAAILRCLA
jgi:hypothetical protein